MRGLDRFLGALALAAPPTTADAMTNIQKPAATAILGIAPGERWLCCLPLSHIGGLGILVRSRLGGTTPVILDRFDVERCVIVGHSDGASISAIYAGSHNPYLEDMARGLFVRLTPYRRYQLNRPERIEESCAEHGAIIDAIAASDTELAQQLMRKHVSIQAEVLGEFVSVMAH